MFRPYPIDHISGPRLTYEMRQGAARVSPPNKDMIPKLCSTLLVSYAANRRNPLQGGAVWVNKT
ncbi:MAG: hypothetical protein Gyms2KO_45170 [Gymnodinialimonas sp.]